MFDLKSGLFWGAVGASAVVAFGLFGLMLVVICAVMFGGLTSAKPDKVATASQEPADEGNPSSPRPLSATDNPEKQSAEPQSGVSVLPVLAAMGLLMLLLMFLASG